MSSHLFQLGQIFGVDDVASIVLSGRQIFAFISSEISVLSRGLIDYLMQIAVKFWSLAKDKIVSQFTALRGSLESQTEISHIVKFLQSVLKNCTSLSKKPSIVDDWRGGKFDHF